MIIEAKNIFKSYGKVDVLKDVSVAIGEAEIVSITGSSGAGKTTLLQILGTLDRADSGQLTIAGVNMSALNEKQLSNFRNQQIGFVFQFHHLLPEFTALENVCIPAFIAKTAKKEAYKRAEELLDFLKMSHRLHHKPSQLSGGEQQRIAVARALMNKPAIILADEPSGNLDEQKSLELHDLFFSLREHFKQTFVIVTHDPILANKSDRKLVMHDGRFEESL